jgi:hypothetical protein
VGLHSGFPGDGIDCDRDYLGRGSVFRLIRHHLAGEDAASVGDRLSEGGLDASVAEDEGRGGGRHDGGEACQEDNPDFGSPRGGKRQSVSVHGITHSTCPVRVTLAWPAI